MIGVCQENFLTASHNKASYVLRETVDSTAAAQKSIDRQARHPPPLPSAFSLSLPLYLEPMIQEEPENSRLALGKVASWKVF